MLILPDASIISKKRLKYCLYLYFYAVSCIRIWFFCSLYWESSNKHMGTIWRPLPSMHFVQLQNLSGNVTYDGLWIWWTGSQCMWQTTRTDTLDGNNKDSNLKRHYTNYWNAYLWMICPVNFKYVCSMTVTASIWNQTAALGLYLLALIFAEWMFISTFLFLSSFVLPPLLSFKELEAS